MYNFGYEGFVKPLTYNPPQGNLNSDVVYSDGKNFCLRKFSYSSDKSPIFIIPPYAGHHPNICERLIQFFKNKNRPVYVFDLFEPTPNTESKYNSIGDLVTFLSVCLDIIGKCHVVGLCQGAGLSAITLSLYKTQQLSYTNAAGPIDTYDPENLIYLYANNIPMGYYEWLVTTAGGVQSKYNQLMGFYLLSGFNLMISRYTSLYLSTLNDDKKQIEKWHKSKQWYDQPMNIAGKWYLQAVRYLFKENRLVTGGLYINNKEVDLSNIKCDTYLIAGGKDNITTPQQVFNMENHVFGSVEKHFIEDSGHIGVFVSKNAMEYGNTIENKMI